MKNEKITLENIKHTGFTSWVDFYLAITLITSGVKETIYEFMETKHKVSTIQLNISSYQLESLVFYECQEYIKPFASSFEELIKKGNDPNFYKQEFVTQDEDGMFELQKIKLERRDIVRLAALEKSSHLEFLKTVEDNHRKKQLSQ